MTVKTAVRIAEIIIFTIKPEIMTINKSNRSRLRDLQNAPYQGTSGLNSAQDYFNRIEDRVHAIKEEEEETSCETCYNKTDNREEMEETSTDRDVISENFYDNIDEIVIMEIDVKDYQENEQKHREYNKPIHC